MSKTERDFLNRYYLAVKDVLDPYKTYERYHNLAILKRVAIDYQDWLDPIIREKDWK